MKVKIGNKKFDDLGEIVNLADFANKYVAIDASYMIYSSILATGNMTSGDQITSHIKVCLDKIIMYKREGIKQLWVFDNPSPRGDKIKRDSAFKMNSSHVASLQTMLKLAGIPYVVAPQGIEAEKYAALLCGEETKGFAAAVMTGDSDVLPFGGNLLIPTKDGNKNRVYKLFRLKKILKETALTYEEFVKMCIALGCDFADKVPGIGPATAIKRTKAGISFTKEQEQTIAMFMEKIKIDENEIVSGNENAEELYDYLQELGFKNIERKLKNLFSF